MLKEYTTFTDQQCWTGPNVLPDDDEPAVTPDEPSSFSNSHSNSHSNSTLEARRKLFTPGESRSPSPDTDAFSSDCSSVPEMCLTPGKVLHTPLSSKSNRPTDAWSSSPMRGRKTSFSPTECMASPMFSPIVKGRRDGASQETSEEEEGEENEEMETTDRSGRGARRFLLNDLTSGELYQTAEINCEDEEETDSGSVSQVSMEVDSATRDGLEASMASHSVVHVGDNMTLSMAQEDAEVEEDEDDADEADEGESKTDTGYGMSHNTPSITNLTPGSASGLSVQDSGMTDNTSGLSTLAPPASKPQPAEQGQQMTSYQVNDTTNDISVGFPLGSSTPTRIKDQAS